MLNRDTLHVDFCLVGGGMAGICAAIAAARGGSRVVLLHERPVLGGNASSEIRMWICGAQGENNRETGILEELMLENFYRNPTKNAYIWDDILYEAVAAEENITLLLNCTCLDAQTEQGTYAFGRSIKITRVTGYQLTTQKFIDVYADYFADCSGDSILAPLTGADFMLGREANTVYGEDVQTAENDDKTMGLSCLIQGRETQKSIAFTPPESALKLTDAAFDDRRPNMCSTSENFWYLELGGTRDTIGETEEIGKDLRALAFGTWDFVKNSGSYDTDTWELEFFGALPGKRESRRMTGEYILTQRDITDNVCFADTAAYGGWPLDDHFPDGFYHKGIPNTRIPTPSPYCIPYRCFYSKNVDNLFFAGRNISASHFAMSSTRVMGTCSAIGQAVGTAMDIARRYSLSPHGVYVEKIAELQRTLLENDCFLPHFARAVAQVCRNTPVRGGDASLQNGHDRVHKLYENEKCGVAVQNGTPLRYDFPALQAVAAVHIVFDSDLNRETIPGDFCERIHATRANVRLDSPQMHMPKTLCSAFTLQLTDENGTEEIVIQNNKKRAYHMSVGRALHGIALIPRANYGDTACTTVFSFDFT